MRPIRLFAACLLVGCGATNDDVVADVPSGNGGTVGAGGAPTNAGGGGTVADMASVAGSMISAGGNGGSIGAGGSAGGGTDAGLKVADGGGVQGADGGKIAGGVGPTGTAGVWQLLTLPGITPEDWVMSVNADLANSGHFYVGSGSNSGHSQTKWWRTTNFGDTWELRNDTTMKGAPWGWSLANRVPGALPTLYSPAGFGMNGAWKSTDGAATWTRLDGADTAFAPFNPFGATATDFYHIAVVPDDPLNHVISTYHYGFKDGSSGVGESWDGGKTWVVHHLPTNSGTSHYAIAISGTTWCVVPQENNGMAGTWRTTTAGRVGGTAAAMYRDGTISPSAWTRVSSLEHLHGSFEAWQAGGVWYAAGFTQIVKSSDQGATWQRIGPSATNGFHATNVVTTGRYIYTNSFFLSGQPEHARALLSDDTSWTRDFAPPPAHGWGGAPFGTSTAHASSIDKDVVLVGGYDWSTGSPGSGVWRYIEP
jgi:hypothetical protein